jgi:DNA-binding ferritin-like protein
MANRKKQEIIETLKNSYTRDIRKQVVKTLLTEEKGQQTSHYKIINQIFSYVLSELGWNMPKSTQEWDSTPLDIMEEVFPQIEKTKWFQEQILLTKKNIEVAMKN